MIRIPAIDLINGTCVRLTKGDFDKSTKYNTDPIEIAKKYENAGAEMIHIIDLDAARGTGTNKKIIFEIEKQTNLKIQTGGGIKTQDQINEFFDRGIHSTIIGSKAQRDRETVKKWIDMYGANKIIIGADVRNLKIAIDGWMSTSEENITDFILEYMMAGAKTFLCTDIQKDGMLQGTSNELYRNLKSKFPSINIIASGGVSGLKNLKELKAMNLYACVIGKALFENRISIHSLFQKSNIL